MIIILLLLFSLGRTELALATSLRHESLGMDFKYLSEVCRAELDNKGPFGDVDPLDFMKQRALRYDMAGVLRVETFREGTLSFEYSEDVSEPDMRFDWQDKGAVSRFVHDQGSLGTCSAFAVTGNIEGQRAIHVDGIMESLSVEQILECSANSDKDHDESNCGVFGGWPKLALEYVKQRGGIATEADWPYCAGTLDPTLTPACFPCMPDGYSREGCDDHDDDFYCNANTTIGQNKKDGWCTSKKFKPRVKISEVRVLTDAGDEETLKKHLVNTGPLAVSLSIGPLQFYRRGILDPPAFVCARTGRPEHVALLTGYGVENGKPYWRLKNSWGVAWGEKGYFRIRRGKNSCGIGNFQVATAQGVHVVAVSSAKYIFDGIPDVMVA